MKGKYVRIVVQNELLIMGLHVIGIFTDFVNGCAIYLYGKLCNKLKQAEFVLYKYVTCEMCVFGAWYTKDVVKHIPWAI